MPEFLPHQFRHNTNFEVNPVDNNCINGKPKHKKINEKNMQKVCIQCFRVRIVKHCGIKFVHLTKTDYCFLVNGILN